MYAVVSTGGKQLKVEKDSLAVVERLQGDIGDVVELDVVFLADGDQIVVDPAKLAVASVKAEIVEHFKADKVVVFKFKKRKGYKRTKGHRQQQTRVRVTEILAVGGGAKKAAKKEAAPVAAPKAAAEPKTAAPKAAAKPKTAAPKAAPAPKTAAPKAAAPKTAAPKAAAKPKTAAAPKAAAPKTAAPKAAAEGAPEKKAPVRRTTKKSETAE